MLMTKEIKQFISADLYTLPEERFPEQIIQLARTDTRHFHALITDQLSYPISGNSCCYGNLLLLIYSLSAYPKQPAGAGKV